MKIRWLVFKRQWRGELEYYGRRLVYIGLTTLVIWLALQLANELARMTP